MKMTTPFLLKTVITLGDGDKHIIKKNKNGDYQNFKLGSNTTRIKISP